MFDANLIAAKVLRRALDRARRFERLRGEDMMRAWRKAASEARKRPAARVKLGPRVQYPKLSPTELSQAGNLDGLLDGDYRR